MIQFEEFRSVKSYEELPEEYQLGIRECIRSAFGNTITDDDAYDHMTGDQLLIAVENDDVVSFTSTNVTSPYELVSDDERYSKEVGLYFAAAAVSRAVQGRGVYKQINTMRLSLLEEAGVNSVFTRTQNPRVETGISTTISDYLKLEDSKFTMYTKSKLLIPGFYGRLLTDVKPAARGVDFDKELNRENGDAFLINWDLS